ncbi:MAG: hypothetical protein AB7I30_03905 [Isosphaeraceae bacterium]
MDNLGTVGDDLSELSSLLNRVAADLDHTAQLYRILGQFWHRVRNDLSGLKVALYLASQEAEGTGRSWGLVRERYDELERLVDRLHRFCRAQPVVPVRLPLALIFEERRRDWDSSLKARKRRLILEPAQEPTHARFDPGRLGQALDDFFAWRLDEAVPGSDLRIGWGVSHGTVAIDWRETVGIRNGARKSRAPRRTSREYPTDSPGSLALLSLPLLTQTVTLHGGRLTIGEAEGWRLRMEWPLNLTPLEETTHVDECRDGGLVQSLLADDRPLRPAG